VELRAILEILWRRKRVIIAVFLSIFLTIMIVTALITPWHDATAKILLRKSTVAASVLTSLGLQGQQLSSTSLSDTDRSDYLALSKLRPVAEKVVAQYDLKRLRTRARLMRAFPWLTPVLKALGVDVSSTEEKIKGEDLVNRDLISYIFPRPYIYVDQYESTDIITMQALSTDPEEAKNMANAMAEAFVNEEVKRVREDFKGAKEYIENNIATYNHEYTKALRKLREFKEREKTLSLESETSDFIAQISGLKQTERDLLLALADTKTKFSQNHPAVIDIQNKIKETQRLIRQKMEKVFGAENMNTDPALRDLAEKMTNKAEPAGSKAGEGELPQGASKYDDDVLMAQLPKKSAVYAQLTLAVSVTQDIYNSLLKSLYQIGIAESIAVSNMYVVEAAITPARNDSKHRHPSLLLNFVVAVFLGLVMGVGAALLVEYLDDTLRTSDDVKSFKGLTFLGSIHKLRKKEAKVIDKTEARSPLREVFRTIRSNIRFASLDKPLKCYAVTSSVEGEGKSFFAVNIAMSLANEGKNVLLIDGDMRRPSIHSYFNITNNVGLTSYLVGDRELEQILAKPPVEGLTIIPTGPIPPDPAKLAESKKMHQLIKTVEERYDMVIIDSPPVFAASDAILLGGYTGAVLILIESGKASRKHFHDVIDMFTKANVDILGVVLNKVSGGRVTYYYQNEYKYS
jgi:succinoglycan biosynthesis transport protein ExoP